MKQRSNYLIKQLDKGRHVKIIYMSHNAYWTYLQHLDLEYENCNADIYGKSTCYIHHEAKDVDLLVLYSSKFYEEDEMEKMQEIALINSAIKPISVGYSYLCGNNGREIKIVCYSNGKREYEVTLSGWEHNHQDLIDVTFETHDMILKDV